MRELQQRAGHGDHAHHARPGRGRRDGRRRRGHVPGPRRRARRTSTRSSTIRASLHAGAAAARSRASTAKPRASCRPIQGIGARPVQPAARAARSTRAARAFMPGAATTSEPQLVAVGDGHTGELLPLRRTRHGDEHDAATPAATTATRCSRSRTCKKHFPIRKGFLRQVGRPGARRWTT